MRMYRRLAREGWLRPRSYSARLRLTILYGGLSLLSGILLLGLTNFLVRQTTDNVFFRSPTDNFVTTPPATFESTSISPQLQAQINAIEVLAAKQRSTDLDQLFTQSVLALGFLTLCSLALGWVVAGRVLRPVRTITATAQRISASNLHERLALSGARDEFKELGDTLDALLDRLEASFASQRHFVANAAHELRTPLAYDRTLLQVALADAHATRADLRSACEAVLQSGREQTELIEALLTLATSERGLDHRDVFDLSVVTADALERFRPDIASRGLALRVTSESSPTSGDARLVERLIRNLLDNAVRHNVPGGWVEVVTGMRAGRSLLSIANTGRSIPPSSIEGMLQPFQRVDAVRGTLASGHGLGLAIVKAVIDAHGGSMTANPRSGGGLVVEVLLDTDDGKIAAASAANAQSHA